MKPALTASVLAISAAIATTLFSSVPAQAQVWNYSPYTGNSNWLSLARTLSYPLNRFSGGYMPLYLGSNLIYAGSYAATQGLRGTARNMNYGNYGNGYGNGAYGNGGNANDQIVHANWKKSQQQQDEEDNVPVPQQQGQQQNDWLMQPIQPGGKQAETLGAMPPHPVSPAVSDSMPPIAPAHQLHQPARGSEPLAMGFVQVVNERFNGDLGQALRDKDLRRYAHSVGLIDSDKTTADNVSRDKADLIRAILADQSESASVKINAVRVLLKH